MLLAGLKWDGIWYICLGVQMPSTTPGGVNEYDNVGFEQLANCNKDFHCLTSNIHHNLSIICVQSQNSKNALQVCSVIINGNIIHSNTYIIFLIIVVIDDNIIHIDLCSSQFIIIENMIHNNI
jgi:hypothetical protein